MAAPAHDDDRDQIPSPLQLPLLTLDTASPEDPSAPVGSKCRLLDSLPAELRNRIYRYALVDSEPIKVGYESTKLKDKEGLDTTEKWKYRFTMSPPLTMVSRQLRQEGLSIYLSENTFEISPFDMAERELRNDSDRVIRLGGTFMIENWEDAFATMAMRLGILQAWCQTSAAHLKRIRVRIPYFTARTSLWSCRITRELVFTATHTQDGIAITDVVTADWRAPDPEPSARYCAHGVEALVTEFKGIPEFVAELRQISIGREDYPYFVLCKMCKVHHHRGW